ncbi:MAG TPA: antibiotic biosynthesis monooxygenase family protein [Devosia sp.]|nr:antibiotic biosynthesis monooxygenase family protein [Devosia sp.]
MTASIVEIAPFAIAENEGKGRLASIGRNSTRDETEPLIQHRPVNAGLGLLVWQVAWLTGHISFALRSCYAAVMAGLSSWRRFLTFWRKRIGTGLTMVGRQPHVPTGEIMIMALIDFEVSPEGRTDLLAALQPLLEEARGCPGNRSFRASTNSESAAHIGLMHEWDTLEQFRAYTSSDLMLRLGQMLRSAMTAAPVSRRLRTDLIEELRG